MLISGKLHRKESNRNTPKNGPYFSKEATSSKAQNYWGYPCQSSGFFNGHNKKGVKSTDVKTSWQQTSWWRSIFGGLVFSRTIIAFLMGIFPGTPTPHLHLPKIIFSRLTIADGKVYPPQPKQEKDWIDPLMVRLPAKLFEKTRIWEVSTTCRGIYAGAREDAIPKGRQTCNDHYSTTLWFIDSNRKISLYSYIYEPLFLNIYTVLTPWNTSYLLIWGLQCLETLVYTWELW